MRIALAQTNILWEDKQANLVRAEEFDSCGRGDRIVPGDESDGILDAYRCDGRNLSTVC